MLKKLIAGGAVVFFLAMSNVALAVNFSDVPQNHKNAAAIQALKDANVITGYPDGAFRPNQQITRAETLALILRAANISYGTSSQQIPFTDVSPDSWYYQVIQKGTALGKLRGYPDRTFRPDNPITLPEAVSLTFAFYNISASRVAVESVIYAGLDANTWYSKAMQFAKNRNLIEPTPTGRINPTAAILRGDVAELIYRTRLMQQTGREYDLTTNWLTEEHQDNYWRIKRPADWVIFKGIRNSSIWKQEIEAPSTPVFFTRMWPANARVSISLADNPNNLSAVQHFANLRRWYPRKYPGAQVLFSETNLSSRPGLKVKIPEKRIIDLIISLPNRNFLVLYGDYGEGPIGEFYKKQVEAVLMSYQYVEKPPVPPPPPVPPLAERLETLRENILVQNQWNNIANLFPDKRLINTDAIGVGTGPVDYYFSREANYTIKIERSSGTILNIREGETSAF